MPLRMNEAARNEAMDNGWDFLDGATIELWTGAQPNTAGGTPAGTKIASGTAPTPALAAASGGYRVPASEWTATATAGGAVGFVRLISGTKTIDGDAGEGSGVFMFTDTTIANGDDVTFTTAGGFGIPSADV